MKLRKIHLTLIFFAILPFLNFIHSDNYCFGVADLLIIGGLTIAFFITFLVISFYDLYNLSIKKLRFNFVPLIIFTLFFIFLFFGLKYHDKHFDKKEVLTFKHVIDDEVSSEIILFDDDTFEVKEINVIETCTLTGNYQLKKDSLFLKARVVNLNTTVFDSIYYFNKEEKLLIPKKINLSKFRVLQ